MALLSVEKRKEFFKRLGLEYNKKGILALQTRYFKRKKDRDGKYGPDTDTLLRHVINVTSHTKNFSPEEFRCPCGECTGYPVRMKVKELKHLQTIRDHYKKPMTITSGLRCKKYNSRLKGSSPTSPHMSGYACDFYIPGVTDTYEHRKKTINYIRKLKNHHYTYGNGVQSFGGTVKYISAPGMGNAMHTDTR